MKEILYNGISKCYIEREDYQQRHQDNILIIIGIVIMGENEASMLNESVYDGDVSPQLGFVPPNREFRNCNIEKRIITPLRVTRDNPS